MITFKQIKEELQDVNIDVSEAALPMPTQPVDPKAKAGELFMRGRALATAAHVAHLMTSSYAGHIALNELYTNIVPLLDDFMESFQGINGKVEVFPNVRESATDGLAICGNFYTWIMKNRALISEASEIQNDIDSIVSFLNRTSYKLRELK